MSDKQEFLDNYKPGLGHLVSAAREQLHSAVEDPIFDELGVQKDRYSVISEVNSGGMKTILQVRDSATSRDLAMAVIPKSSTPTVVESFLREARISAQLQHPNIIPVYDIGINSDQRPFFTMKLVSGESLQDIINKLGEGNEEYINKYPLPRLLDIYRKVCEAVSYAHSKGILHLDLKPDNIRISSFGDVLLCDWGLARVLDEVCEDPDVERYSMDSFQLNNMTIDGFIKGTPGFMAPEQTGGGGEVDCRTDIYAMGAILYSLFTCRKIIETNTLEEYVILCRQGVITPPYLVPSPIEVPRRLEAVCMKALEVLPGDRYQQVQDILADINAWSEGYTTEAEDSTFLLQLKLLYQRNRLLIIPLLCSAVILIGLTLVFIIRLESSKAETEAALSELKSEKEVKGKLAAKAVVRHLAAVEESLILRDYQEVYAHLQSALDLDPYSENTNRLMARFYLIHAEFDKAAKYYEKANDDEELKLAISLKNSKDSERTLDLFKYSQKNYPELYPHMLGVLSRKLIPAEDLKRFITELLDLDNPGLQSLTVLNGDKLEINDRNLINGRVLSLAEVKTLDLSYSRITDFSFINSMNAENLILHRSVIEDLVPFAGVNLESLDISHSKLKTFKGFDECKIKSLNISGIHLRETGILRKIESLKQLTMDVQDHPQHLMFEFRKAGIEVIDSGISSKPLKPIKPFRPKPDFRELKFKRKSPDFWSGLSVT